MRIGLREGSEIYPVGGEVTRPLKHRRIDLDKIERRRPIDCKDYVPISISGNECGTRRPLFSLACCTNSVVRPRSCMALSVRMPRSSLPTAVNTAAVFPSLCNTAEKLRGAPPRYSTSPNTSHRTSPMLRIFTVNSPFKSSDHHDPRRGFRLQRADYSPLAMLSSEGSGALPGSDKAVDWRTTSLKSRR